MVGIREEVGKVGCSWGYLISNENSKREVCWRCAFASLRGLGVSRV